jgi:hypothetical protein
VRALPNRRMTRLAFIVGVLLLVGALAAATARSSIGAPAGPPGGQSRPSGPAPAQTGTTATPAHNLLFSDNFERDPTGANPPAGWTAVDGRWSGVIGNDTHVVQHASGPFGHLVAGSVGWTDYSVAADVMPTPSRTGFAAIAGRYRDAGDYYQCDLHHASSLQLWRVRRGIATVLGSRPVAIDPIHFSNLRLVMGGRQLSCVLNGAIALRATDGSLTSGETALVAGDSDPAEFDNVTVTTP